MPLAQHTLLENVTGRGVVRQADHTDHVLVRFVERVRRQCSAWPDRGRLR
jgi:hypothetical protein